MKVNVNKVNVNTLTTVNVNVVRLLILKLSMLSSHDADMNMQISGKYKSAKHFITIRTTTAYSINRGFHFANWFA